MKKTTDKPKQPHEKKIHPEAPGRFPSRETKERRDMPKDQDTYGTIPGAEPDEWHPTASNNRHDRDDFDNEFDDDEEE